MECVFVNGTVGVGKSTVADAISAAEAAPHAVIDLDAVRRMHPAPVEDVFNHELELRNLRSLAANYREAGARRLILAGVIEAPAEVGRYAEAAGATALLVCRLVAAPDVVERRLRSRHHDDPAGLAWHLRRAGELAAILEGAALDDVVVDATDATPSQLARAVRAAAGWDAA